MNNGMNPNENNNFSGEVLGSVDNTNNVNNNPMPNEVETLETLDNSMVTPTNANESQVMDNNSSMVLDTPPQTNTVQPQSVPPVMPEPAYTNPQNINPMPGFEQSNTIGTTPPISLEPEKEPKKKKTNKTLFILIIIIVLFGIGFGTYYVLKYTDILSNTPKITIDAKTIDVNMGDTLSTNINDFASVTGTDVKNCTINTDSVNMEVAGTYTYQITCGEIYKSGTINVIDNTELDVNVQNVYKTKGSTVEATEFILQPKADYTYEIINTEEVNTYLNGEFGNYTVKIKATSGTKTTEVEATLTILEHAIKGYLSCKSNEQNLANSSTTKVVEEKFAIVDDGNNGFGGITTESYIFKFTDETEYTNYLAEYKTNGTLTIDNVTGNVVFNDEALTITISNPVSKENVISKYGESNMVNYRSIRSYFLDTLKYSCSYKEVVN